MPPWNLQPTLTHLPTIICALHTHLPFTTCLLLFIPAAFTERHFLPLPMPVRACHTHTCSASPATAYLVVVTPCPVYMPAYHHTMPYAGSSVQKRELPLPLPAHTPLPGKAEKEENLKPACYCLPYTPNYIHLLCYRKRTLPSSAFFLPCLPAGGRWDREEGG